MKKNIIGNFSGGGGGTAALRFWHDESGQGVVEYAIILAVLSIATTLGLTSLGKSTNNDITELQGGLDPDASEVVFQTEDGERISRGFYSSYNPIVIPEVPDKAGTSGKYWSLDGETIATESSIRTAAASGERLVLSPIYTVTLTVDGEAFTISGLGEEFSGIQTHISTEAIIGKNYSISFCGDSNFHYWKMCDTTTRYDRLLSTNPDYEFKTATNLHIVASSQRQANMAEICFLSTEDIRKSSDYIINNATSNLIVLPSERPIYSGRVFDGWTINGSGLYSEEEICAELANRLNSEAPSSLYLVRAHFTAITTPIDVTINFATIEGNRVKSIVGDSVTITLSGPGYKTITLADSEIPEGYYVWFWLIGDYPVESSIENVDRASYSHTTRLNPLSARPVVLTVVVGEEEIEQVATAAIQPLVKFEDNGTKKIACVNLYYVPSGDSVIEKGVIYTSDPLLVEFLNVEEYASYEGIKRARSTKADLGTVTLSKTMKTDEDLAATWYFRSYIVYQANGVSYVAYSSVHSGNYDSLPYKD